MACGWSCGACGMIRGLDIMPSFAAGNDDFDKEKAGAFQKKITTAIMGTAITNMVAVGHNCGLFEAMDWLGAPSTSTQIAAEAKCNERYVREWLAACSTVKRERA